MADTKTTPLRERMIEDMRIKGLGESSQKAHIRAVRYFAEFLGRSPDTATPEDLRAYQLHMVNTNVTPSTYNMRLVGLRFFFETTCQCPEMKQCLHYRTEPRKLPVVFSAEEVFELLKVAPGPGLKYRAALSVSYGTGLRASEVCNLKVTDIDSDRMLIHVEKGKGGKDRKVMLSPAYLSRYTHRVAISNHRLVSADADTVAFRWKDYRIKREDRMKVMRLATDGFIRRFLIYVLPDRFHRIRHYGFLAGSGRKEKVARVRAVLGTAGSGEPDQPEDDLKEPLTLREPCPDCGGPMHIIETCRRGGVPRSRAPPRLQAAR